MYTYCGKSKSYEFIDIVDWETLIKTKVSHRRFTELLFDKQIKPNSGDELRFFIGSFPKVATIDFLSRDRYKLRFSLRNEDRDGDAIRQSCLDYFVSTHDNTWRVNTNIWENHGIYIYFDRQEKKVHLWYKDYLHTISYIDDSNTFVTLVLLGVFIENGKLFCRCAYNLFLDYYDFPICGKDVVNKRACLHAESRSLSSLKRMILF